MTTLQAEIEALKRRLAELERTKTPVPNCVAQRVKLVCAQAFLHGATK